MKLLSTAITIGAIVHTDSAAVRGRHLSYDDIMSYSPGSNVMDHARIDLDQKKLQSYLSSSYTDAKAVYDLGAYSKSYAQCSFDSSEWSALQAAMSSGTIAKGTKIFFQGVGTAAQNAAGATFYVEGKAYADYDTSGASASDIRIQYNVPGETDDATTFSPSTGDPINPGDSQCWGNRKSLITGDRSESGCIKGSEQNEAGSLSVKSTFVIGTGASGASGCATGESSTGFSSCATVTAQLTATCYTKNGRTLRGFSTAAKSKMFDPSLSSKDCPDALTPPQSTKGYPNGCPYTSFIPYFNYYCAGAGSPCHADGAYGDVIVQAALAGDNGAVGLTHGGMDFTGIDDKARKEMIKKGTAYITAWMYAVREFEDAIDDCTVGIAANNDDPVHAWDEGVAFYVGTMSSADLAAVEGGDAGKGYLAYTLANKRCENFRTCGIHGDASSGEAKVNKDLWRLFTEGKNKLSVGDCGGTVPVKDAIVKKMTIPLVQGTLRYAYKQATSATATEKEEGEGAIFAAAILPQLHACNPVAAAVVYGHMNINHQSPVDHTAVKAAMESCYNKMGITCSDVGGLYSNGAYLTSDGSAAAINGGASDPVHSAKVFDASPCVDASSRNPPPPPSPPSPPPSPPPTEVTVTVEKDKLPAYAVGIIVAVSILAVLFVLGFCFLVSKERSGHAIFLNLPNKGASA